MNAEVILDEMAFRAARQTFELQGLKHSHLSDEEMVLLINLAKGYVKMLKEDVYAHIQAKYLHWKTVDEVKTLLESDKEKLLIQIEHKEGSRKFLHNLMCRRILQMNGKDAPESEREKVKLLAIAIDELF